MNVATIDFETEAIAGRPDYPPKPVGVAVHLPGWRASKYYAWGHPTENNTTRVDATRLLQAVWKDHQILCWNAKFDLEVARVHLGLQWPTRGAHDAMILAFLDDPHVPDLHLKPYSDRVLGVPPAERDAVRDWVMTNSPAAKGKPKKWKDWAAHICEAPGKLVGEYARGDVDRTRAVYDRLWKSVTVDRGMRAAYDREMALMPHLVEMERGGVPVDLQRLRADLAEWDEWLAVTDRWLRHRLKSPGLEVDSGSQLADAMERAGVVTEWILTPKGARSTARDALMEVVTDESVREVLAYRGKLANAIRNFGRPWVEMAERAGAPLIYTEWKQVRAEQGGARTGRFSSRPNFQNIPKNPEKKDLIVPKPLRLLAGTLPYMRNYVAPPRGWSLVDRDYSQQELRILAHYEDGVLLRAYLDDPRLDMHALAQERINRQLGTSYARKPIKNLGFAIIYGAGIGKTAIMLEVEVATAKSIRSAYLGTFPGLKSLIDELKSRAFKKQPIHTWGGREYHVERPRFVDGRLRVYDYKLLNVLVQGSAADCTKQAMLNYFSAPHEGRMLITLHDELLVCVPTKAAKEEDRRLREAMESVKFDVAMLTGGARGAKSWGALQEGGH